MDALAVRGLGLSSVAILGVQQSVPVLTHVAIIAKLYRTVLLVADKDSLGEWVKWQISLGKLGIHGEVREPWPGYKDIAAMPLEERREFFGAYL
jgi:hypothetical protein